MTWQMAMGESMIPGGHGHQVLSWHWAWYYGIGQGFMALVIRMVRVSFLPNFCILTMFINKSNGIEMEFFQSWQVRARSAIKSG